LGGVIYLPTIMYCCWDLDTKYWRRYIDLVGVGILPEIGGLCHLKSGLPFANGLIAGICDI
jgi:hypothetical protein